MTRGAARSRMVSPPTRLKIIRNGTADGMRSHAFWGVVFTLKSRGFTLDRIVALLKKYPDGIAQKYIGRLRHEIGRVYNKIEKGPQGTPPTEGQPPTDNFILLRAAEVPVKPVEWLWSNQLALGKLTMLTERARQVDPLDRLDRAAHPRLGMAPTCRSKAIRRDHAPVGSPS